MERCITDHNAKNKILNVQPKRIIYFTCSLNTRYLSSKNIIVEKVKIMQDLKDREEHFEKGFIWIWHDHVDYELAVAMVTCRRSAQDYASENPSIDW